MEVGLCNLMTTVDFIEKKRKETKTNLFPNPRTASRTFFFRVTPSSDYISPRVSL